MTVSKLPSRDELILFRKRKEPSLGIFVGAINDKVSVFSEEGKEVSIDPQRIAFSSGIKIEGDRTQSEKKLKLREMRRHLEEKKEGIDLVTIWECFEGVEGEVMFDDLKELYFGDKEIKNEDALVLFWSVDKNDEYFRRGECGYEPRTRDEAEEIIRKKETEERRKKEREQALYWAKGVISGAAKKQIEGFDPEEYIQMLREYIIHLDKYNRAGEAKSFLSEIGVRDVEGAIEFLIKAGGWGEEEDPVIQRFSIREDFPDSVESETDEIIGEPLPKEGFEDLRELEIFSIDDENTEDIDDALSITPTPEGLLIGVHIANVAAFIPKWSDTDEEAARRGETIYLPEKRIHMFPPRLIKEKLSLFEKTERASLSLLVLFDDELNIKSHRFTNSIIRVRRNLNYSQGTDYFLSAPDGIKMREIALGLRRRRFEAGALIVQLPQLKIGISEDGEIMIQKNHMKTEAHVVVTEMMILMNRMAGNYLSERGIPGIYRSQPEEVSEEARTYDETDPLYPVRIVRFMRAPRVGLSPEPHKSLGLDVYTQVTSPIRRYTDLIIQRQIVSDLLYGDTAYTEDELETLYPRVETGIREKRTVQRHREKYWLYKYLKTLEGTVIEGVISSLNGTRASVYLPDYLFETNVNLATDSLLEEGKTVRLLVQRVDPLRKTLRLSAVPS